MANKKISDLVELTTPSPTDKLAIVHEGVTKSITVENLVAEAGFNAANKAKVDNITVTAAVDLDEIRVRVTELDAAVVLKGGWSASSGTFPGGGSAQAGWSYIVTAAGTVNGISFSVNDRLLAYSDNASSSTYANNWLKLDYTDQFLSLDGQIGAQTLGAIIDTLSSKSTLSSMDKFPISDVGVSKEISWANLLVNITSGIARVTDITHSNLVALVDSSTLIPGMFYRITDFRTMYSQEVFDSEGGFISTTTKTAAVSPIIVCAESTSILYEDAIQPEFPEDRIKYLLKYTLFTGASTYGRIIQRRDKYHNQMEFDFRTVKVLRFLDSVTGVYSTVFDNTAPSIELPTFDPIAYSNGYYKNNQIGDIYRQDNSSYDLSNIVFLGGYCENNKLGKNAKNLTFASNATNNNFTECFINNVVFGEFSSNNCSSASFYKLQLSGSNIYNCNFTSSFLSNITTLDYPQISDCTFEMMYLVTFTGGSFSENSIKIISETDITLTTEFKGNSIDRIERSTITVDTFNYNIIGLVVDSTISTASIFTNNTLRIISFMTLGTLNYATQLNGTSNLLSGEYSSILSGYNNTASSKASALFGIRGNSFTTAGKVVTGGGGSISGGAQAGKLVMFADTNNSTTKELAVDGTVSNSIYQITPTDNQMIRVRGSIIGKRSGSTTNVAAWDFDYIVVRGAGASSLVSPVSNMNQITNVPGWTAPSFTVDTTNGYMSIKVTGATGQQIRWVASIDSTEVIK